MAGAPQTIAIINPSSGGGRAGARWPEMKAALDAVLAEKGLGPVEGRFTAARGDAISLTRAALAEGASHIIAVGGDGTVNEVVNGFFSEDGSDTLVNPEAVLSLFMAGTGGDFRRSFGLENDADFINSIVNGQVRRLDIGRAEFTAHNGQRTHRYFDNILSFGMSGRVCQIVDNASWQKRFGGTFTFNYAVAKSFLTWRNMPVRLSVDGAEDGLYNINTLAICNGKFFGSGMMPAPNADPFDGIFDITCIAETTMLDVLTSSGALRNGTALEHKRVSFRQGREIEIAPLTNAPLPFEIDGETPGYASAEEPARVRILPGAIAFKI